MIRVSLATIALLSIALPAFAQTAPTEPPKRIRNVMLAPGEKCPPPSSGDEVVVCGNLDEQYRIPKGLRNAAPIAPQKQAWAAKQDRLDEVGREAGGLPDTCSPVGTGGQTGCTQVMLSHARADKREGNTAPPR